jgi:hypothetical protein
MHPKEQVKGALAMRNARTMALLMTAVLLQLLGAPRLHAADPVAVLVQMSGAVQVQHTGKAPASATIGMHLMPGDKVLVPAGGKAVLLYRTGKMQTATSEITVSDTKAAQSSGLFSRTVQTLSVVATTDARAHPNRQGMIRPIAGSAVPISPRNQIKVLAVRPTLVWFRIADAPAYVVQLRRIDGACTNVAAGATAPALCKPVRFEAKRDTAFTLAGSEPALVRGAVYEWAVAPTSGGRVSETQRFRIAGDADYAKINMRLKELTAAGLDPATDGAFLSALAYRNAGLFYDAQAALARIDQSAASGRAYHQLKGEVLDALGDLEGAAHEFSQADAESGS